MRPSHSLSEGRPLLAVSESSWGPAGVSTHVFSGLCGRLPLPGHRGLGQSVAPQSSCPGFSGRQGSHLPYIFMGLAGQQELRPVSSGALRIRITRPGSTSPTQGHASGCTVAPFGQWVHTYSRRLRCCSFTHIGGRRSDDPASNSMVTGALVAGRAVT